MKRFVFFLSFLLVSICCFSQARYISATTKKIVYTRDGGKCKCCGSTQQLEYDHIVPYSCGGSNDRNNIQLLCQKCNRSKSNDCYCHIHGKKVGIDCCNDKEQKIRSGINSHPNTAQQCTGMTKKGTRCRNRTTNASGRCYLHQ